MLSRALRHAEAFLASLPDRPVGPPVDPDALLAALGHELTEASRRARGFTLYAALRSLGRRGLAELIERNCAQAALFARLLRDGGAEILNDVVLNQVLVAAPPSAIARVQADGTCWVGGTVWHGREAMRISVSSWATTDQDVERSAQAILRAITAP